MKVLINKKAKKTVASFILVIITALIAVNISLPVYAQGAGAGADAAIPETPAGAGAGDQPGSQGDQTAPDIAVPDTTAPTERVIPLQPTGYEDLPQLTTSTPTGMLYEFTQGVFRNLKYILGAVAVFFIMVSAVKLIIAGDSEDVVTKQKTAITYGIIGLIVIAFSDEIARVLTVACPPEEPECSQGGFLSGPQALIQQASIFEREVKILITFIKYLVGGIAVFMLIRNGIRLVALQGSEESVTLDKKNIAFSSIGLVLIIIASTFIDKVLYIVDTSQYPVGGVQPGISPEAGVQEIIGFTNLAVTFTAPIAILVLIVGAVMYATAGGNEENMNRAKRLIMLAVIGMVIIYGAFAIVSTIISGQFTP
jgi:hypothetical protein